MFKLAGLDPSLGVVPSERMHLPAMNTARETALARHPMRVLEARASAREPGPTITAMLEDGPLAGRRIELDVVEGRPPKTIDVPADVASACRYCLADWAQSGPSAVYTFLYRVPE